MLTRSCKAWQGLARYGDSVQPGQEDVFLVGSSSTLPERVFPAKVSRDLVDLVSLLLPCKALQDSATFADVNSRTRELARSLNNPWPLKAGVALCLCQAFHSSPNDTQCTVSPPLNVDISPFSVLLSFRTLVPSRFPSGNFPRFVVKQGNFVPILSFIISSTPLLSQFFRDRNLPKLGLRSSWSPLFNLRLATVLLPLV